MQERVTILIEQLRKFGVEEKLLFTAEGSGLSGVQSRIM